MLCRSELRGLGDLHDKLVAAGGAVLAISSDTVHDSRRTTEQLGLNFDLLSDPDGATIEAYGLLFHEPYHDKNVALPANFLLDRDGRIAWRRVSPRVNDRPAPAQVAEQIDRLLTAS